MLNLIFYKGIVFKDIGIDESIKHIKAIIRLIIK